MAALVAAGRATWLVAASLLAFAIYLQPPIAESTAAPVATVAAVLGWLFGSAYDGTLVPFALCFFSLSTIALLLVLSAEGRAGMFRLEGGS